VGGIALAALIAAMMVVATPSARAACTQNGNIISCVDTTNVPVGTGNEDNLTVNVQAGATVDVSGTAGATAIDLRDNNTVNNAGTVIAGDNALGISVRNGNVVNNSGTVIVGNDSVGINACCDNTIVNSGTIIAGSATGMTTAGILATDNTNITNTGVINVGENAYGIFANDGFNAGGNAIIANMGLITAGDMGFGIGAIANYNILNAGTITVGAGGSAIQVGEGNVVVNLGAIHVGAGGIAFDLNGLGGMSGTNNILNAGSVFAPNGFSILGFSDGNTIINTGYLQGTIGLLGANTLTNQGYVIIGDPIAYAAGFAIMFGGTLINDPTGTLAVRVDPFSNDTYQADTITLNGGRLHVVVTPGLYEQMTVYSQATTGGAPFSICGCGTLTGTFESVVSSSPFFTATATYDYGQGEIDITLNRIPFGSVPGLTPNQRAVGIALEGGYSTALTGDAATLYGNLLAATSVTVLDNVSGEGTSATQNAAFGIGSLFNNAMQNQGLFGPNGPANGAPPLSYADAAA
jgi:hypothetical protein